MLYIFKKFLFYKLLLKIRFYKKLNGSKYDLNFLDHGPVWFRAF
jgi:hypothetical protein